MKFSKQQLLDLIKIIVAFLIVNFVPENAPSDAINEVINWIAVLLLGGDGAVRSIRTLLKIDR